MRLRLLLVVFLGMFCSGFSQNLKSTGLRVSLLDLSSSKDEKSIKSSYRKILKEKTFDYLDKSDFKFINKNLSEKDSTYTIGLTYWVDKKGDVISNLIGSTFRLKNPDLHKKMRETLLSSAINRKNKLAKKTLLNKQHFLILKIKKEANNNFTLVKKTKKKKTTRTDSIIPPLYKKCDTKEFTYSESDYKERKKCFENSIKNFVMEKVDEKRLNKIGIHLAQKHGLFAKKIKTYIFFELDENGKANVQGALGLLPSIEEEFLVMIANDFPNAQPALEKGQPVKVSYSLPLIFCTPKAQTN